MEKEVLLTISILCPGTNEDMFKTLDSIKPILDKVSSELIIVDTGCSPEFRKRLEAYTDQFVDFKWTGNFAEARNVGLDAAHGKWYLGIDDDEWFIDVKEIVDFFNRDYYKMFNGASYVQRNFFDYAEIRYVDSPVLRMFCIEHGERWTGKIHETPQFYGNPHIAALGSTVKHFGYIYKNEEEKEAKFKRNIVPLLEMTKEEPNNLHWDYQIVQEYFGNGKWEEVLAAAKTGFDKIKDVDLGRENNYRNTFYYVMIRYYETHGDREKMYELLNEAINEKRTTDIGHAGFAKMACQYCIEDQNYEGAIEHAKVYEKMYRKLHNDRLELVRQSCLYMDDIFTEINYNSMQIMRLDAMFALGIYDEADAIVKRTQWEYSRINERVVDLIINMVKAMVRDGARPCFAKIIDELAGKEDTAYGINGNITFMTAGDLAAIKRVADCFMDCKYDFPLIHRQKVLATSDQMRVMANSVMTQIVSLRNAGQNEQADAIENQLNGILEKMPVGGI